MLKFYKPGTETLVHPTYKIIKKMCARGIYK